MLLSLAACEPLDTGQNRPAEHTGSPPDIIATNAFYYYEDVDIAWQFYRDVLGLETVVDYGFAKIMRLAEDSYLTLVRASEGMHSADEPKNRIAEPCHGYPGSVGRASRRAKRANAGAARRIRGQ